MRAIVLAATLSVCLNAEVVDRIAVIVDRQVITETQIDEDLRVTAFLNQQIVSKDPATRRTAAHRLIDQLLIRHEMELGNYPAPSVQDINAYSAQIESAIGNENFDRLLASYRLDRATLKDHLEAQLMILRFVEYRFEPEADQQSPVDRQSIPENALKGETIGRRTDAALEAWLESRRKQAKIRYLNQSLR